VARGLGEALQLLGGGGQEGVHPAAQRLGALQALEAELVDTLLERVAELLGDDGPERAELALDAVHLLDQDLEDAVFDPLRVEEVVAEDLAGLLEGAVDAAVPLLQATRVPRDIEVEEVRAVGSGASRWRSARSIIFAMSSRGPVTA
jgi:hypothetical protein